MLIYAEHFTFSPTSKDVCVLVCGMPAAETIMLAPANISNDMYQESNNKDV